MRTVSVTMIGLIKKKAKYKIFLLFYIIILIIIYIILKINTLVHIHSLINSKNHK